MVNTSETLYLSDTHARYLALYKELFGNPSYLTFDDWLHLTVDGRSRAIETLERNLRQRNRDLLGASDLPKNTEDAW